jgi:hypothetical protein
MTGFTDEQVFLGNWGEVWFDGEYMAEVKSFRAEINISYEDISRVRSLMKGKKMTEIEGSGEVVLHKVSSYIMKKIADSLKKGVAPRFTIMSKLDDPNAEGSERIVCYDCVFEKSILADWERGSVGEESYSFNFGDWAILDAV